METAEEVDVSPLKIGFTPRGHKIVDGETVGTIVGIDGQPIVGEMVNIPVSGPISLSQIGQHLLNQNKMWMDNGYMKDLAQRPERTQVLSNYYGAAWGSPHTTIDMCAGGMAVYKWDWRYDGDSNTSGAGNSTTGAWGTTSHFAELKNKSSMSAPGAYSGNGYFRNKGSQTYRLTFSWDRYSKTNSTHQSYMGVAVWGYKNGYLNGARTDLVAYQNFNATNNRSGTKSYNFSGNSSYSHTVVNFTWWCPEWKGETEGIECSILNAKVARTA